MFGCVRYIGIHFHQLYMYRQLVCPDLNTDFRFCPDIRFRVLKTSGFCPLCSFRVLTGSVYVKKKMSNVYL